MVINIIALTYFFLLITSGIIDIWMFFKITKLKNVSYFKIAILSIVIIILIPVISRGLIFFANLLEILVFGIVFRKEKNKYLILGTVFTICTLDLLVDIISGMIVSILNLAIKSIDEDAIAKILLMLIVIVIVKKISSYLYLSFTNKNKKVCLAIVIYLYISSVIVTIFYMLERKVTPLFFFFTAFLIIQSIFVIGAYYELTKIQSDLLKKSEQDKIIQEQEQLQEYTKYLEESEDELRAFRHDYRNMFNSLKISAQEGNTKEVIQKLDEYTNANLNAKAFEKYRDVNHIKIKSLKSIIIAKLTEMYREHIPYNFECSSEITKLPKNINEIDLVRIVGISCDNAIEESKVLIEQNQEAHIEIMVYSNERGEFEYEIQNKRSNSEISIKQIQRSGYSTKKSHSGLGLANINSIKNKYENMTISYEVPEGYFDFYLVIEPEEETEE